MPLTASVVPSDLKLLTGFQLSAFVRWDIRRDPSLLPVFTLLLLSASFFCSSNVVLNIGTRFFSASDGLSEISEKFPLGT